MLIDNTGSAEPGNASGECGQSVYKIGINLLFRRAVSALRASGIAAVTGLLCALAAEPADAAYVQVAFDFSTLTPTTNTTTAGTRIMSSMNAALAAAGFSSQVTSVTGAALSNSYTGDGHVVGCTQRPCSSAFTLAQLDPNSSTGGAGTFIQNASPSYNSFTINFQSGINISNISFDYEIFPDGSCTNYYTSCGTNHSNLPSISLDLNGNQIFSANAVVPGQSPPAGSGGLDTGYKYSVASGWGTEKAPQLIGSISLAVGATNLSSLTFNDWPATIAIANLVFTTTKRVPEPGSLVLLFSGVFAMYVIRRRSLAGRV